MNKKISPLHMKTGHKKVPVYELVPSKSQMRKTLADKKKSFAQLEELPIMGLYLEAVKPML